MSFGKNLKRVMSEKTVTAKMLAEYIGVSRGLVTHWTNDIRNPNPKQLEKIIEYLKISSENLFNDEKPIQHFIPLVGKASCGIPQEYDLNGYEPFPIDSKLYQKGMYAVEAEGDSMSPKINEGDVVYCCPENICEIKNNDIVHYRLNDESGIKRFKINEDQTIISLVPINTAYDVITVKWEDGVDLKLAKVVGSVDLDY